MIKNPIKEFCLKPGDVVDIIATAPGIEKEKIKYQLEKLQRVFSFLSLKANYDIDALIEGANFFSDQALKIRQQELIKALSNKHSKAIWFFKGGYGSARLLPDLCQYKDRFIKKILIGYSDITPIHLWVHKYLNWPSLHASVLCEYLDKNGEDELKKIMNILLKKENDLVYDHLEPLNQYAQKSNLDINGVITGGTIQVLQSGIGLDWQFDAKDKILFLEEVYDRGVRIDRTLNQFFELGLFKNVKAIILGDIVCGIDPQGTKSCQQAINYFAKKISVPVFRIQNFGHAKLNYPLPLNLTCTIKRNSDKIELKFSLTVL